MTKRISPWHGNPHTLAGKGLPFTPNWAPWEQAHLGSSWPSPGTAALVLRLLIVLPEGHASVGVSWLGDFGQVFLACWLIQNLLAGWLFFLLAASTVL